MSEISLEENKLGKMPVPKLLFTMSLPAIFSMLVMSLYNIVDSLFVAKVSGLALDAISFAFPLQQIMLAFALGVGVGTNSIVARKLGEKNRLMADKLAQTGLKLAICNVVLFMILGSFLPNLFMKLFTKNATIVNMGTQYLTICMVCCFGMMIETTISKILQATGNMIIPMLSQLLGAVINIVFDPIFIFVCKMGIVGAGVATVMGQIIAMIFVLLLAYKKRKDINIFFKDIKFEWSKLKEIIRVGLPVMIMNAVSGIIVIIMNSIIIKYSAKAPSALGVYFKLQSFVFMPVFGLNQGALPILSYNFGSNSPKRYKKAFYLSLAVSVIIMALGTVLFQLVPEQLISLFENTSSEAEALDYAELLKVGTVTLKVISYSFVFAGINIIVTTAYQSLGYGMTSLIMSLLRQIVFTVPTAILFGNLWGLDALWWSYPFSDMMVTAIFFPYFFFCYKKSFAKRQKIAETESVEMVENGFEQTQIDDVQNCVKESDVENSQSLIEQNENQKDCESDEN